VYWYNVSISHYIVDEGEMNFSVTVESNDPDPRGYAISATGTGIEIEDFDLGTETGTASYLTTGTFTITLGITLDIPEGTEYFTVTLYEYGNYDNQFGTSLAVQINDTSTS